MKSAICVAWLSVFFVTCFAGRHSGQLQKVKSSNEDISDEYDQTNSGKSGEEKLLDIITEKPVVIKPRNLTFLISGSNLAKLPVRTVNPYVSMFYESSKSDLNALSSEVVVGNANPCWNQVFSFMWKKGTDQKIKFKVKNQIKKASDQLLGEVTLNVDEYVENDEQIELHLKGDGSKETIKIEKTIPISFRLAARGLARRDTFHSKSDPYVKCYWRHGPDGTDVQFAQTSVIDNVENADWADIITYDAYQPGKDQYWNFRVYDQDRFTKDEPLGDAFVKIDNLVENGTIRTKTVNLSMKGALTIKLI